METHHRLVRKMPRNLPSIPGHVVSSHDGNMPAQLNIKGDKRCSDADREKTVKRIVAAGHDGLIDTPTTEARCAAARNAETKNTLSNLQSDLPAAAEPYPPWKTLTVTSLVMLGFLIGGTIGGDEILAASRGARSSTGYAVGMGITSAAGVILAIAVIVTWGVFMSDRQSEIREARACRNCGRQK